MELGGSDGQRRFGGLERACEADADLQAGLLGRNNIYQFATLSPSHLVFERLDQAFSKDLTQR